MNKRKTSKNRATMEIMFATLLLILGFSYLIRDIIANVFQSQNIPFVFAVIIGLIGLVDGAVLKERLIRSIVIFINRASQKPVKKNRSDQEVR